MPSLRNSDWCHVFFISIMVLRMDAIKRYSGTNYKHFSIESRGNNITQELATDGFTKHQIRRCKVTGFFADCSGCNLKKIPQYLSRNITYLDLSNNQITNDRGLGLYIKLKNLDLSKNKLQFISDDAYVGLNELQVLNLQHNIILKKGSTFCHFF